MLSLDLAIRFFIPKQRRFIFYLAIVSVILGVAFLVVTLAVVSGFESSLKRSVIDVTGDVFVTTRRARREDWSDMWNNIKPEIAHVMADEAPELDFKKAVATPFLFSQGIVANKGQLTGVVVQAVDKSMDGLNLESRLIDGEVSLVKTDSKYLPVLIGRGLSEKLGLKVSDSFKIVFPIVDQYNTESFRRKVGRFKVRGILDLGQHKYDERYIVANIVDMRELIAVGKGYSGLIISLPSSELARSVSLRINNEFPSRYRSRDWFQANRNLFQAIVIERRVIFLVVSIVLIVAAFNLSSTLFINVVQKYREISILKSLGLGRRAVISVFLWQGVLIGLLGLLGGVTLGYLFIEIFQYILENHLRIPGDVYKLNKLDLEMNYLDVLMISAFTLLVCLISTLAPAINGSRISVTDGLRYE